MVLLASLCPELIDRVNPVWISAAVVFERHHVLSDPAVRYIQTRQFSNLYMSVGSELAKAVKEYLAADKDAVRARIYEEAEWLKQEVRNGAFDNTQALVGLEFEFYTVDEQTHGLRRVPRPAFGKIGFEKELGLHNTEMSTTPQPLSAPGLSAQQKEIHARFEATQRGLRLSNLRLVSDGIWTIPPVGETATQYLLDTVEEAGIRIGTNVSSEIRYHAIANAEYPSKMEIDTPHATLKGGRPEMVTTSIQPHYQVPHAPDLPDYFQYALRVAGPLTALGANSPLFPPSVYDDDVTPETVLRDTWKENRIRVFETALNPPKDAKKCHPKVQFPPDFKTIEDAIDALADDDLILPVRPERGTRFDDNFAHFREKSGSYWRWIRPVFSGKNRTEANARIEFRPLSGQPTIRDVVAFQAVFAGLMESLPKQEHPLAQMEWETARQNFYVAAQDGLKADLTWVTMDGAEVVDHDRLYNELFEHARAGLARRGLTDEQISAYVAPLEKRAERRMTPARWKVERVQSNLDQGLSFFDAIKEMQTRYIDMQMETFIDGTFIEWLPTTSTV